MNDGDVDGHDDELSRRRKAERPSCSPIDALLTGNLCRLAAAVQWERRRNYILLWNADTMHGWMSEGFDKMETLGDFCDLIGI